MIMTKSSKLTKDDEIDDSLTQYKYYKLLGFVSFNYLKNTETLLKNFQYLVVALCILKLINYICAKHFQKPIMLKVGS